MTFPYHVRSGRAVPGPWVARPAGRADGSVLHDVRGGATPRRVAADGGELDQGAAAEGAPHPGRASPHLGGGPRVVHAAPRDARAAGAHGRGPRAAEGARDRGARPGPGGRGAAARRDGVCGGSGLPRLRRRRRGRAVRAGRRGSAGRRGGRRRGAPRAAPRSRAERGPGRRHRTERVARGAPRGRVRGRDIGPCGRGRAPRRGGGGAPRRRTRAAGRGACAHTAPSPALASSALNQRAGAAMLAWRSASPSARSRMSSTLAVLALLACAAAPRAAPRGHVDPEAVREARRLTVEQGGRWASPRAISHYLSARRLVRAGDAEKAVEQLRLAIAYDEQNPELHVSLAEALTLVGQLDAAEVEARHALELGDGAGPTASDAHV